MANYNYIGDKFYIGDLPLDDENVYFFYEENGNIRLVNNPYNKEDSEELTSFRIYGGLHQNKLYYEAIGTEAGLVKNETLYPLQVSRKWYDRGDALTILSFFCCLSILTLWLVNLFTSIFKKGGLLSGLF